MAALKDIVIAILVLWALKDVLQMVYTLAVRSAIKQRESDEWRQSWDIHLESDAVIARQLQLYGHSDIDAMRYDCHCRGCMG